MIKNKIFLFRNIKQNECLWILNKINLKIFIFFCLNLEYDNTDKNVEDTTLLPRVLFLDFVERVPCVPSSSLFCLHVQWNVNNTEKNILGFLCTGQSLWPLLVLWIRFIYVYIWGEVFYLFSFTASYWVLRSDEVGSLSRSLNRQMLQMKMTLSSIVNKSL